MSPIGESAHAGGPRRTRAPWYPYVLSFCSGMSIMAVELSASRLVAPVFGTSTYVWTNIIGVIMITGEGGVCFHVRYAFHWYRWKALTSNNRMGIIRALLVRANFPANRS